MDTIEKITNGHAVIVDDDVVNMVKCDLTGKIADCFEIEVDGSQWFINTGDATDIINGDYPMLEWLSDYRIDDTVEAMLDEVYGEVSICGMEYRAGNALKRLNPVAFRQTVQVYINVQLSKKIWVKLNDRLYKKV